MDYIGSSWDEARQKNFGGAVFLSPFPILPFSFLPFPLLYPCTALSLSSNCPFPPLSLLSPSAIPLPSFTLLLSSSISPFLLRSRPLKSG